MAASGLLLLYRAAIRLTGMAALRATCLMLTLCLGLVVADATGQPARGQLVGLFTLTGGSCKHAGRLAGCELAMSGVVTLTTAAGKVRRIKVGMKHPSDLRLKNGRFRASLPGGIFQISDRVSKHRGGGTCGVYATGPGFDISNPFAPVTSISIKPGNRTYVHINCFGH
jgi:hypothetical protein